MTRYSVWAIFWLLAVIPAAQAYIGPGPGLSMLGSLLTLVVGVFVALAMVLIYPIRLMLKRKRQQKEAAGANTGDSKSS